MRRLPFLSLLVALSGTIAHAGEGLNLRWSECLGDGGAYFRSFACDTNVGNHVLVGSFQLTTPVEQVTGEEIAVGFYWGGAAIPDWWSFRNVGSCRINSLSANFIPPPTAVNCVDWSFGQVLGGISSYGPGFQLGSARLRLAAAISSDVFPDLAAGVEYFSFVVSINNVKTVGGACAGCSLPACIILSSMRLTTHTPETDRNLFGPTNGTDSFFTSWQGPVPIPPGGLPCPWPVPARQKTWGAVKSLYR